MSVCKDYKILYSKIRKKSHYGQSPPLFLLFSHIFLSSSSHFPSPLPRDQIPFMQLRSAGRCKLWQLVQTEAGRETGFGERCKITSY